MATDAFGRLRTSNPFTTFNYYPSPSYTRTTDYDTWILAENGEGNIQYNSNNNCIDLNLDSDPGQDDTDFAYRATKLPMDYQPGKSRLIMMSVVMINTIPPAGEQVYTRVGLINHTNTISADINDGIWFELDGSENKICWCEKIQDSAGTGYTLNKTFQESWNIDTFDGTGPSGKTITINDMNKNSLIVIDQEWLGVGRVRCGFNIDGVTYYAHAFNHTNIDRAYTKLPRQRLSYHISTTTNARTQSYRLRQICCTCISEGGFFPVGIRNSVCNNYQGIALDSSTFLKRILLAIKINTNTLFKDAILKIININIGFKSGASTNNNEHMKFEVQLHSTNGNIGDISSNASGVPTFDFTDLSNSIISYNNTNTNNFYILSDGYKITSGFLSSNSTIDFASSDFSTILTRANITQYDTLYICANSPSTQSPYGTAAIDLIESL